MKIFLILIIAICQALIVIVPIKFKLVDNRRSFPKDLTKQGKFLIFLCALTVVCSVKLFQVSEKEESASKRELESGLQKRDSLYEVRLKQLNDSYTKKVDRATKKARRLS